MTSSNNVAIKNPGKSRFPPKIIAPNTANSPPRNIIATGRCIASGNNLKRLIVRTKDGMSCTLPTKDQANTNPVAIRKKANMY
jgi:hypothetical protein